MKHFSLFSVILLCASFTCANAQQPQLQPGGWRFAAGVAPVLSPMFEGSSDYALSIFPDIRAYYDDVFFASIPEGMGYNVINTQRWKAGPLAKIRFGRDEEQGGSPFIISGDTDALRGLGSIDAAAELGGFVQYSYEALQARMEMRQGVGGHTGMVADASLNYSGRRGNIIYSAGPRLTAASTQYMDTYFGIDNMQSLQSGLTPYKAEGGIVSYGVGSAVIMPVTSQLSATLFGGYTHLGAQAGDSPLVEERGSPHQATIGIAFGYRFGW